MIPHEAATISKALNAQTLIGSVFLSWWKPCHLFHFTKLWLN